MANITYYELSNYNGGILLPKTFELDGLTYDEHLAEITEWLEELTEETGELCEEWIVCDYEDVPSNLVSEWTIDREYFDVMEAVDSSHLDKEAFMAGISLGISLDKIEDAYHGHFDSDEELAEYHVDSCCDLPEWAEAYFDYAAFGRDMAYEYIEEDGHYFHSDW